MKDKINHLNKKVTYMKKYFQDYTTQHTKFTNRQHYVQGKYNHTLLKMQWLTLNHPGAYSSNLREPKNQGHDFIFVPIECSHGEEKE